MFVMLYFGSLEKQHIPIILSFATRFTTAMVRTNVLHIVKQLTRFSWLKAHSIW